MSKAAKQIAFILILVILILLGVTGYILTEKKKADDENIRLKQQLTETEKRANDYFAQNKTLNDKVRGYETENESLQGKVSQANEEVTRVRDELAEIADEKDKWQRRVDEIVQDRDKLMNRVKELVEQSADQKEEIADLENQLAQNNTNSTSVQPTVKAPQIIRDQYTPPAVSIPANEITDEEYWATVLREKAALEVQIEDLKEELSKKSIEIVNLKQQTADFQLDIDNLRLEKEEVERDIKYKTDLINNLSIDLARAKNDKKFVTERAEKIKSENLELRKQLKTLVSAKGALEKNIVRLTEEKEDVERKLVGTEGVIQSKIDEIWDIKDSIDETFKTNRYSGSSNEVELPPIVVNSEGQAVNFNDGASHPGFDGRIVNLNEENNFVIVDIGENEGVNLGDRLSVYRDSKYVARLEVIQVRKDICAADIKDQWSKVKIGDIVH
ncbi:MAG: hypothetical protein H6755_02345 [Candidatus Omnitrophica bacterium]|nr:hypothetical protein [Candidatus Omnitrophota bacterium]